ncbi:class I SAM-dependent methyltransferase [Geodermatophilus sp. CPCC 206100]|uniref:class I SAM-dependent methyltransferase n=1 Tax=Geodermatophilus sp. CPCC 206100 TaxID=3020054 RepID=UPI003B00C37A
MSRYDRIGRSYADTRRADPRIAAAIHRPLAGMVSVVDVGAGTGSYEPAATIAAVEPSAVMIAQRPPGAAPVVQSVAEAIPLRDGAADAAMAVLTLHHWRDVDAGLAELRRIARRRVVVLTSDVEVAKRYWLVREYLPRLAEVEVDAALALDHVVAELGASSVTPVPVPHDCTDGFAAAYWRRPAAYLDPRVRAGASVLASAGADELHAGLEELARDLRSGAWQRRHADLLDRAELDAGYRLVVTDLP